jgi:hypothetical protein
VGSDSASTRARTTSRSADGSAAGRDSSSRRAASSSSAKNGFALGLVADLGHQRGRRPRAEDLADQLAQVATAEGAEVQPLGVAAALELGEERPQRVAAVEVVAAVGQHRADAGAHLADQEAQQVARRLVGPVEVLGHQQDRRAAGEPGEDAEQQLEQPGRRHRLGAAGPRAELRHQLRELAARVAEHLVELGGPEQPGQRPRRVDQRGVREDAVADVEAAAGERDGAGVGGPAHQLADEPGLAHPGFAADHDGRGLAGRGTGEGRPQAGDLAVATDEHRTGDSLRHEPDHVSDPLSAKGFRAIARVFPR